LKATGKLGSSLAAYRTVAERYPDTKAAELAKERMGAFSQDSAVVDNATGARTSKKTSGAAASKKAASRLNMAKLYVKLNPEKAKQFAQEAIDASPADSPTAAEAKKLLEDLSQQK
jgi:hypothetical protein